MFERLISIEFQSARLISKGKEKSRMGDLPTALIAGGIAGALVTNSLGPLLYTFIVRIAISPVFLLIGVAYKKSGAWSREAEFLATLDMEPIVKRIEKNANEKKRTSNL